MDQASAISPYFEATRLHAPSIQPQANSTWSKCLFWMNQDEMSEIQSHHLFHSESFSLSDLSSFRLTHWMNRPPQVLNRS